MRRLKEKNVLQDEANCLQSKWLILNQVNEKTVNEMTVDETTFDEKTAERKQL